MSHRNDCKIELCNKAIFGHGYCQKHWRRLKTHGDPLAYSYRDPNTYRLVKDVVEIELRDIKGNLLGIAKADSKYADLLLQHKWGLSGEKKYAKTTITGKGVYMHVLIKGKVPGKVIDHINQDGLDNREVNLRRCTHSDNLVNAPSKNPAGHKGIFQRKDTGKWIAQITINRQQHRLGNFATRQEAINAYRKFALKLRGEFLDTRSSYGT